MILRVYAMARPRRPAVELEAVRAADDGEGPASARAKRLARAVAVATLAEVDREPEERVIGLLRALEVSPLRQLALDPEIDTAALVRSERQARAEARGWRRLPEKDWPSEDREVLRAVCLTLARRYAEILRG